MKLFFIRKGSNELSKQEEAYKIAFYYYYYPNLTPPGFINITVAVCHIYPFREDTYSFYEERNISADVRNRKGNICADIWYTCSYTSPSSAWPLVSTAHKL